MDKTEKYASLCNCFSTRYHIHLLVATLTFSAVSSEKITATRGIQKKKKKTYGICAIMVTYNNLLKLYLAPVEYSTWSERIYMENGCMFGAWTTGNPERCLFIGEFARILCSLCCMGITFYKIDQLNQLIQIINVTILSCQWNGKEKCMPTCVFYAF